MPTLVKLTKDEPKTLVVKPAAKTPKLVDINHSLAHNDSPTYLNIGPKATDYKRKEQRQAIYDDGDMYVGSDEMTEREEWILDLVEMVMRYVNINDPYAVERIFLEILSNASDNVGRSRREGVDPGTIEVLMSNKAISIKNGGLPIPVEIHPEEKVYVPELIFGTLQTSSNYDVERHEAGKNGIGAKACNIFSKSFMVIVEDAIRGLKYTQVWNENMRPEYRGEPIIEPFDGKNSSTQVVYEMDFDRFGYHIPEGTDGGYGGSFISLVARHVADTSFTAKVKTSFNGIEFDFSNIKEYAKLYFGDKVNNMLVHYEWPADTEVKNKRGGVQIAKDPSVVAKVEMLVLDTPDAGRNISFVNCLMTRDGGVHTDAAVNAVAKNIVKTINDSIDKKYKKKNKGNDMDAKTKRSSHIGLADVKPHISMILSCRLRDTRFNSQTKSYLASFSKQEKAMITRKELFHLTEDELKCINRWELYDRLYATLEAKQFKNLLKTDGKKRRRITTLKGEDANLAGKKQSAECSLYITEGDSASAYALKMIGLMINGRDKNGILPLRGKGLNVMNATIDKIANNREICELKTMLGLTEGLDYTKDENFKTLRYGCLVMLADSDNDGKHIMGLVMLYFHCRFPSLLARGFLMYYRTPIIRAVKGKIKKKFYTETRYQQWREYAHDSDSYKIKYYKGLGSSSDADIKDDFKVLSPVYCIYDDEAPQAMRLAFDKKMADQRKKWINEWQPVLGVDEIERQPISWFIKYEFIHFSRDDLHRSIPRMMDGLKVSQRKVLWGAFTKWGIAPMKGTTKKKTIDVKKLDITATIIDAHGNVTRRPLRKKEHEEFKVGRFANYCAEETNYHHGENGLNDVTVAMAQDFLGANNMPYFTQDGQFGCVDPNTEIRVWDGDTILAKDVKVGDELWGDDGHRRTVQSIVSGIDDMYIVHQTSGVDYTVNSIHILTLIDIRGCEPKVIDICLKDYLMLGDSERSLLRGINFLSMGHGDGYKGHEINVEYKGVGPYCGWQIDGNERFLLGDFTVTHNTRNKGGKDAAQTRYSFIRPEWWIPYVYRKEDLPLMDRIEDENILTEPKTLYPIIPMGLVNGSAGIGTGWSTFCPNHNPIDIVQWLRERIQESDDLPQVLPWYRGFKGEILIVDRRKKDKDGKIKVTTVKTTTLPTPIPRIGVNVVDDDGKRDVNEADVEEMAVENIEAEEDDTPHEDQNEDAPEDETKEEKKPLLSMVTRGIYEADLMGKVVVRELPIGKWTHNYTKMLEKWAADSKIGDFRNLSTDTEVYYEIPRMKVTPTFKTLKLQRSYGLTNLTFLDIDDHSYQYDTVNDILETFYQNRLPIYEQRRQFILQVIIQDIKVLSDKIRFIRAVIDKELKIMNEKKADILARMQEINLPAELLTNTRASNFSEDEITTLTSEIDRRQQDHDYYNSITASEIWLDDLDEFEEAYMAKMGEDGLNDQTQSFTNVKLRAGKLPMIKKRRIQYENPIRMQLPTNSKKGRLQLAVQ